VDPSELTGAVYDQEMFLRTMVEPAEAFVGQQVVMTIYLYTTLQLSNVNVTREASTDGFWAEDLLGPTRRIDFEDQFIGPTRFRVAVLRRVALFPLRDGTLTIGAPQLEAAPAFRSIFSRRTSTVARTGVPVEVLANPVPEKGRPSGFSSGNVGRYALNAKVDRNEVKVGEPVTLTLTISGEGHLKNLKLAPLEDIEGTRMYEPRIEDAVTKRGGRLGGQRRLEYLIMPQKTGVLELPAVELVYFDPVAARFETRRTKSIEVRVTGSDRVERAEAEPEIEGVTPNTDDLAPLRSIHRESALSSGADALYSRTWFLLAVILIPIGFLALVIVDGFRRRRLASRDVLRSRRAAAVALKRLKKIGKGESPPEEELIQVTRALHGFFADRFGEPVSGLTMDELRAFLRERDVPDEVAARTVELFGRSEEARYGGGGGADLSSRFAAEARELIKQLDGSAASSPSKGGKS